MSKTVAIISCIDTKFAEIAYLRQQLSLHGLSSYIIDASLRPHAVDEPIADMPREALLTWGKIPLEEYEARSKSEKIRIVTKLLEGVALDLYKRGVIQGCIAAGGLQNSVMGSAALRRLPFGVPKILISAMANSNMPLQMFTGRTDVVIVPSVADVAGLNQITRTVFDNACAMMAGMLRLKQLPSQGALTEKMVGVTCVGVTNEGVLHLAERLRAAGYTPVMFHATTGGARAMEDLALDGTFAGLLDLDIHDVLVEALGYYVVNESREPRLVRLADKGIPMIVSFSGMDVIDMPRSFFESAAMPEREGRKVSVHNPELYHVKVTKAEARKCAEVMAERLNRFTGPLAVVAPLRGFRDCTQPGESLYDPEVDSILLDVVKASLKPEIRWVEVDCNANDPLFGDTVLKTWLDLQHKAAPDADSQRRI